MDWKAPSSDDTASSYTVRIYSAVAGGGDPFGSPAAKTYTGLLWNNDPAVTGLSTSVDGNDGATVYSYTLPDGHGLADGERGWLAGWLWVRPWLGWFWLASALLLHRQLGRPGPGPRLGAAAATTGTSCPPTNTHHPPSFCFW